MKVVQPQPHWPESWKSSYQFDLSDVYGQHEHLGYAYAYELRRDKTIELVQEVLPRGATIIDIAAGQGNFSLWLAERGYRVTWNDLRGDLAGYVKLKQDGGEVNFAGGNAFDLQFDEPFDAVLITEVIEHVAHPDDFLMKTANMVKPGGYIIMTTPNGAYLNNKLPRFSDCPDPSVFESEQFKPDGDGHIFLLYPDEIRRFAAHAGLLIDKVSYFTTPLTSGFLKTAPLLRVMPKAMVKAIESLVQSLPVPLSSKLLLQVGVRFRKPATA